MDKVHNIVRETMLHENALDRFFFEREGRRAVFEFNQMDPERSRPDSCLLLTFSGVVSLMLDVAPQCAHFGGHVTAFTCESFEGLYRARLTTRDTDSPECHLRLVFEDLEFTRRPKQAA